MKTLSDKYLMKFKKEVGKKIERNMKKLIQGHQENNFEYYIDTSAVFSSNIEGNSMDLNSFMNVKTFKTKIRNKEYSEILDLIKAYSFAKKNLLNEKNLLKAHKIISDKFLIKSNQGKYREEKAGVFDAGGLVYMALEPEYVKVEMKKLFDDIADLISHKLSLEETFYYASMLHLKFVHIHPFMDGNGRAARLLEKWFLSMKLKDIAWKMNSEKYYFENRNKYYKNINLGPDYYELNYKKCLPFLKMLTASVK